MRLRKPNYSATWALRLRSFASPRTCTAEEKDELIAYEAARPPARVHPHVTRTSPARHLAFLQASFAACCGGQLPWLLERNQCLGRDE
jgi:hypothetical protein